MNAYRWIVSLLLCDEMNAHRWDYVVLRHKKRRPLRIEGGMTENKSCNPPSSEEGATSWDAVLKHKRRPLRIKGGGTTENKSCHPPSSEEGYNSHGASSRRLNSQVPINSERQLQGDPKVKRRPSIRKESGKQENRVSSRRAKCKVTRDLRTCQAVMRRWRHGGILKELERKSYSAPTGNESALRFRFVLVSEYPFDLFVNNEKTVRKPEMRSL
ncbi:hypothetical protein CDAR_283221 [Caerostris darwini]|uniref:Uncharacterized protein n=1 Tax=Caerostris darwini TaxID=1538125 RepID=A0AAV4TVA8_9ARAC|nr:hypothetical protein CDAR_283221 [Caerostris darwini]